MMHLFLIPPLKRLSLDSVQPLSVSMAAAVDMSIARTTAAFTVESTAWFYGYGYGGCTVITLYCPY